MTKWPLMKNTITLKDRMKMAWFLLSSSRYTNGPKVKEFEQRFADWVGTEYALMVSSGSTANFLLLAAVMELHGLKKGDKVVVPACTWVTNVAPVIQLGLTPIFCDVNLNDYSFCHDSLRAIAKKHKDIKVVFTTHLLGYPANVSALEYILPDAIHLNDICESHGVSDIYGRKYGGISDYGSTFSFYFAHHITTVEGGMITTNNRQLYNLMKIKRSHGMAREAIYPQKYYKKYPDVDPQFLFVTDGYNFRSMEINAVLGIEQLKRLPSYIKKRQENVYEFFKMVPLGGKIRNVTYYSNGSNYGFPMICDSPSTKVRLEILLNENGIEYRPIIGGNLLRQPFLEGYGNPEDFPNAETLHHCGLYIGNNHFVGDKELKILEGIIKEINL